MNSTLIVFLPVLTCKHVGQKQGQGDGGGGGGGQKQGQGDESKDYKN